MLYASVHPNPKEGKGKTPLVPMPGLNGNMPGMGRLVRTLPRSTFHSVGMKGVGAGLLHVLEAVASRQLDSAGLCLATTGGDGYKYEQFCVST